MILSYKLFKTNDSIQNSSEGLLLYIHPLEAYRKVSSGEADRTALEAWPGHGPVCDFGQVPASAERDCKRSHSQGVEAQEMMSRVEPPTPG